MQDAWFERVSVSDFAGSGHTYTFKVKPASDPSTINLSIAAGAAKNGEHAMRRCQRGERIRYVVNVLGSAPAHIVAAENDQVRPFRHHHCYGCFDILARHGEASVLVSL